MPSLPTLILLGLFAAVLVASALTIWLILALGNGPVAVLTPLVLSLVLLVIGRSATRWGRGRGEDRGGRDSDGPKP